jgi:CheY-like chemotaxis protein
MPPVVLTIDDDETTHNFVKKALGEDFCIKTAMSGEEGLELAAEYHPDVILLDVAMPGLTGYQVCDRIVHDDALKVIPVVFLSSLSSTRDRMQGYEAGGTDFIVKPFEADALKAKLKVLVDKHALEVQLRSAASEAQKTAMLALTSTSELGQVIQFVESVASINNVDALAMQVLKTCNNMGLNCILFVDTGAEPGWYSPWESISPLEKEVITMLRFEQRINDFGARTVINYPLVSIMVKNMPNDDPERYGQIKDIVPAILTTANGKIEVMNSTDALRRQSVDLTQTFDKARDSLTGLFERSQHYQHEVDQTLRGMFQELQTKLPYMGLDEDQELYIVDRIDSSILTVRDIEDQSMQVFGSIQDTLQDLGDLVERVQAQSEKAENTIPEFDGPTDEVHSVELF